MIHFLFLGNLIPSKGVPILLEACRILREKGLSFHCHIAGAPTGEMSLEQARHMMQERSLTSCVTLYGGVYGNNKEELFKQCHVFVFPTQYPNECFPLVLLEAMQHSLPTIATPVGAIPDIVEDGVTGLIVPEQDAKALAEAMQSFIEHPERIRSMGEAALDRFLRNYTKSFFEKRLTIILKEKESGI